MNDIYSSILKKRAEGKKMLAVLIDPDKSSDDKLAKIASQWKSQGPDFIFVGGSLVNSDTKNVVDNIRLLSNVPIVLFPGDMSQFVDDADALLLLSLISGRNAEYLIGQHIKAACRIKQSGVEVLPTGYILIDGGVVTSVQYISGTTPIPNNKIDIAVATAMAGELLGLKMLYIEAGSGASQYVPTDMIRAIRQSVDIPLIVGGGLRTKESVEAVCKAGADVVVVGTAIEDNPLFLSEILNVMR